ncbi:MAG TPA: hypothetical protein PLX18_06065 [Anaerohalosphaeraceae bacterium]|jgi:hypothetical protein|nr:hypothetical protein [Anaerohalosphaeraceae bacterium]HOT72716.1 hypothetical protein [Anaerohalosphaeraceae bacterium]HPB92168.1 hypothetical protein [Anaerohalosphaeraceae bacterium]HQG04874.1 hypothetical protein [Anaerohalosphaeraceae bacterium]HQI07409.1 hypothetical protein [Anaerohalosphaeraceae bacterium]
MKTTEAIYKLQRFLEGSHPLDEQIHRSLNFLEERLEELKQKSPLFEKVSFSEDVIRLAERAVMAAAH